VPPPKYFRLAPGKEVRLRYGYIIKCQDFVKNSDTGEIEEVHCTYDPETRVVMLLMAVKSRGPYIGFCDHALDAEVRMYDRLFISPNPGKTEEGKSFLDDLNPESLKIINAKVEASLAEAKPGMHYQFERKGFFCVDLDSAKGKLVFNQTVPLRDSWAKIESGQKK